MIRRFFTVIAVTTALLAGADTVVMDDVNRDGVTNVGDVNAVLNGVLSGGYRSRLDVNRDGTVNVGDVNAVLNVILTGEHIVSRSSYDYVWDYDALPEVHIEVPLDQWNTLLASYDADRLTKQYIHADLRFVQRGEVTEVSDIGIRMRGNGSRKRPEYHPGDPHHTDNNLWLPCGFGVNLRKWHKDDAHTISGVRKLWLRYFYNDPTFVREFYSFRLYEAFGVWTVPRTAYCRVWLHVEGDAKPAYYGIYFLMEPIDERYLKDRKAQFGTDSGDLWKCGKGEAFLRPVSDDHFGWDDNGEMDERDYVLKTNTGEFERARALLQQFISSLNTIGDDEFHDWIQRVMDVDMFLKTYAVMATLGSWDDFWNNGNNYYLYFTTGGPEGYRVMFIPYDLDNTLGSSRLVGNVTDTGIQDPMRWGLDNNVLLPRLLQHEDYRRIYIGYLKQLVDADADLFHHDASVKRINGWYDIIKPYIPCDLYILNRLYDEPSPTSNIHFYRLLSGTERTNFFKARTAVIDSVIVANGVR